SPSDICTFPYTTLFRSQVSNARLREQDAAGKVRVAEAQLAEARRKHAADSSQVIRAEERLASAQRALSRAQDVTKASSEQLAERSEEHTSELQSRENLV